MDCRATTRPGGSTRWAVERFSSTRRVALVLLVIVALLIPVIPGAIPNREVRNAASGQVGSYTSTSRVDATPAADRTAASTSGPRNVLADAPCNTSGNSEVAEAYDSALGYLYVAWVGCGGIGFSRSVDGGYSFEQALTIPGSTAGVAADPEVAVAPNGTVFVAFMLDDVNGDAPHVARSFDHGASFPAEVPAFVPVSGSVSTRDALAVAPNGTVYLTWIYSPDGAEDQQQCDPTGACWFTAGDLNAVVAFSTDGGASWSPPAAINTDYPDGGIAAAPIVIAPDGALDVLLETFAVGGGHELSTGVDQFARSTDGGSLWTNATPLSASTFPTATRWVDASVSLTTGGALVAAFDATNGSSDDVYAVGSTNNGTNWSSPIRLNPDTDGAAHGLVTVAAGANGTAHAVWLANNSSQGWLAFAVNLTDNGSRTGPAYSVSAQPGLPGLALGATLGVADLGGGAFAVAWSYGLTYDRVTASQVFSAVMGENLPIDAPTITSVVPGPGQVTLGWLPPTGPEDRVAGFVVVWGLLNQRTFYNLTYSSETTFAVVTGLPVDYAWYFDVAATNGAGAGPTSTKVNVTLTAWGILRGEVSPASATITLDGSPVPVSNGTYLLNTSIGIHLLESIAPSYEPFSQPLTLPWNGTLWLNVTLALLPGLVTGYVTPINASVLFDGAGVSVDPTGRFTIGNVPAGAHVLSASFAGYVSTTRNVPVLAGGTSWVNLTLARANGTLHLEVIPPGAIARFNESEIALSGAGQANVTVPPGVYVLNVTATGYVSQQQNVTIVSATTNSVTIVLLEAPPVKNPTGTSPTLPLLTGYVIVIVAVVVVAAVGTALLIVRRRRHAEEPDAPEALWESDAPDGGDEGGATGPDAPTPPSGSS